MRIWALRNEKFHVSLVFIGMRVHTMGTTIFGGLTGQPYFGELDIQGESSN